MGNVASAKKRHPLGVPSKVELLNLLIQKANITAGCIARVGNLLFQPRGCDLLGTAVTQTNVASINMDVIVITCITKRRRRDSGTTPLARWIATATGHITVAGKNRLGFAFISIKSGKVAQVAAFCGRVCSLTKTTRGGTRDVIEVQSA